MRVAVDGTYYQPGLWGGAVTVFRSVVPQLCRLPDTEVTVLMRADAEPEEVERLTAAAGGADRLRVRRVPVPRGPAGRARSILGRHFWPSLTPVTREARAANPDVVYLPISTFDAARFSAPAVFTIHDLQHEYLPHLFHPKERWLRRAHFNLIRRGAAVVTVPSEYVKGTLLERLKLRPERVRVTPWGIDDGFQPVADAEALARIREAHHLPPRFFYFPANPWLHKNHRVLLKALTLPEARDFHLVFSGFLRGPAGSERAALEREIDDLGLRDRVHCPGYLPFHDLPALYSLATALVNPSRYEGFGLPLLEAMRCRCPVICSTATSLPEVAGDAAVLVSPDDPEGWAAAMARLDRDEGLRADLIARGEARARQFSWASTAARVREALDLAVSTASA